MHQFSISIALSIQVQCKNYTNPLNVGDVGWHTALKSGTPIPFKGQRIMAKDVRLRRVTNLILRTLRPLAHYLSDSVHSKRIARLVNRKFPDLKITNSSIILDLGSNRGRFAKAFAQTGGIIWCFEPNPDVFSSAVKLLKTYPNVFHMQAAVARNSGMTKLFLHKSRNIDPIGFSISASIDSNKENVSPENYYVVPAISLASILENLNHVDLLKIDIEGAEKELWPTIEENYMSIKHLVLEPHRMDGSEAWYERASKFIEENGLQTKWFLDWE